MGRQHLTSKQKISRKPRSRLAIGLVTGLTFGNMTAPARGTPYQFSYSGRLANTVGDAVKGPVDLDIKFYRSASGGTAIPVSPIAKRGVGLVDGVFQVDLNELTAAETHLVFAPKLDTWVEVTDATNKTTYPRQRLTAVPYAFKVPVDETAVTYDGEGRLTVNTIAMSQVSGLEAALTQKTDSSKPVYASGIQGRDVNPVAPAAGQTLVFDGNRWTPQPLPVGTTGTVTSVTATAPLTVSNGTSTPALMMAAATSVSNGYLTSADWLNFNSKQNLLGFSPLNKAGDIMTGALNMGGQDLTSVGNMGISPQKTLNLGVYTTAQESILLSSLSGSPGGKTWFNSTANQMKYWDGTAAQTLGVSGAGLTSLNGITGSSQTFASGTSGAAPYWSSTSSVHTLNIPMASSGSVTAGLISNSDYTVFASKVASLTAGSGISVAGTTTPTVSLSDIGTSGTYTKVTTNAQGQVTSGSSLAATDIPSLDTSKITSGILSMARGGTGLSAGSSGGIPYFTSGGTEMASTPAGSVGQVLMSNGTNPVFSNLDVSSATGVLPLSSGGTGATNSTSARNNLGAAQSGANYDISSLNFGNIGIGTTTPLGKLNVVSSGSPAILVQSSSNSEIKMASSSLYGYLTLDTSGNLTVKSASGQVALNTGGFDALVVKPSGSVGIGTNTPTGDLSFGGNNPRTLTVERNSTSNHGYPFTIKSGGAGSGSNLNGGDLNLSSGVATGSGSSKVVLSAVAPGNSGTADQTPTPKMTVHGYGVQIQGSVSVKTIVSSASIYNVLPDDAVIILTWSGTVSVYIPSCTGSELGRLLTIVNRSATGVGFSGANISGSPSLSSANTTARLVCDGAGYWQTI